METEAKLPSAADVAVIRAGMKLSQAKFAALLGISVRTLQGWEALRREPDGPARVLLLVVKHRPEAITESLNSRKQTHGRAGSRKLICSLFVSFSGFRL